MSFLEMVYDVEPIVTEAKQTDYGETLRSMGFKIQTINPTSFGQEFILLRNISASEKSELKELGFEITGPNSVFVKF